MQKRIVKRTKHTEEYQKQKLRSSIHASCLSAREFAGAAEVTAEKVCQHVEDWLDQKHEVTSDDLRRVAASALYQYNPSAAYIYVTVSDVN
jgi:transcriptional regulator NrdR family protein